VAPWSERKLPRQLLDEERLRLMGIEKSVCCIVLRRRLVAAGLLVQDDLVLTANVENISAASVGFSGPVGTVTVTPVQVMRAGELSSILLSELVGKSAIDVAGKLRRSEVSFQWAVDEAEADQHLALWRDELGNVFTAAINSPLKKKQAVPPGTPCFDPALRFTGLVAADGSRVVPARQVLRFFLSVG
jgi:hypothetical protein